MRGSAAAERTAGVALTVGAPSSPPPSSGRGSRIKGLRQTPPSSPALLGVSHLRIPPAAECQRRVSEEGVSNTQGNLSTNTALYRLRFFLPWRRRHVAEFLSSRPPGSALPLFSSPWTVLK